VQYNDGDVEDLSEFEIRRILASGAPDAAGHTTGQPDLAIERKLHQPEPASKRKRQQPRWQEQYHTRDNDVAVSRSNAKAATAIPKSKPCADKKRKKRQVCWQRHAWVGQKVVRLFLSHNKHGVRIKSRKPFLGTVIGYSPPSSTQKRALWQILLDSGKKEAIDEVAVVKAFADFCRFRDEKKSQRRRVKTRSVPFPICTSAIWGVRWWTKA
jgi:hypothetical protein